jgi:microcystin-dependent protein
VCKKNIYILYTMNQNKYSPQSAFIKKSYGSVNVYDNIRDKWITLQTHQIGDTKFSAHQYDHNGWLICDGRSLSRTNYAELYDIIGIQFGANNSTTFKLPDMRGRVAGGIGDGVGLTARTMGNAVGSETHTLTVGEMPTHNHGIIDPGHTHSYTNNTNDQTVSALPGETAADQADLSATTGTSTTGITTVTAGSSLAHNNMQPTLFIGNMFIYGPSTVSPY